MLDTYLSFEVHTEITIKAGRKELIRFSKLILVIHAVNNTNFNLKSD